VGQGCSSSGTSLSKIRSAVRIHHRGAEKKLHWRNRPHSES
jgi:hypothetical protein